MNPSLNFPFSLRVSQSYPNPGTSRGLASVQSTCPRRRVCRRRRALVVPKEGRVDRVDTIVWFEGPPQNSPVHLATDAVKARLAVCRQHLHEVIAARLCRMVIAFLMVASHRLSRYPFSHCHGTCYHNYKLVFTSSNTIEDLIGITCVDSICPL